MKYDAAKHAKVVDAFRKLFLYEFKSPLDMGDEEIWDIYQEMDELPHLTLAVLGYRNTEQLLED